MLVPEYCLNNQAVSLMSRTRENNFSFTRPPAHPSTFKLPVVAVSASQIISFTLTRLPHIMSELAFAKSFLSSLDSRPIKLRADHVFDPERVGLRVPVCLLS